MGADPSVMSHPASALDDLVHQRVRLGVLAIAHETDRTEFGSLQNALDLTSGNLSRHLHALEAAGLVTAERGYEGRRPRTWIRITKQGRDALAQELSCLKELIARVEQQSSASPAEP